MSEPVLPPTLRAVYEVWVQVHLAGARLRGAEFRGGSAAYAVLASEVARLGPDGLLAATRAYFAAVYERAGTTGRRMRQDTPFRRCPELPPNHVLLVDREGVVRGGVHLGGGPP